MERAERAERVEEGWRKGKIEGKSINQLQKVDVFTEGGERWGGPRRGGTKFYLLNGGGGDTTMKKRLENIVVGRSLAGGRD